MAESTKRQGSSKKTAKKTSGSKQAAKRADPLSMLLENAPRQQRLGIGAAQDSRGLAEHLLGSIPWKKMLPALLPLILSVLHGKHAARALRTPGSCGHAPVESVVPSGGATPQLDLISLLGSLLGGTSGLTPSQPQPQADPLGGLLQALGGASGAPAPLQGDLLGGPLQALDGAATRPSQPQSDPLSGLLRALGGAQAA